MAIAAAAVLGMGAVAAVSMSATPVQQSVKYGGLGSAHDHAAFVIRLDSDYVDLSQLQYQVKSPYIHVENGIGTTLHKHAESAPFGEFLASIDMSVTNGCFVTDSDARYCPEDDKKLRFFLNNTEQDIGDLMKYVLTDNDRFLIIYGNENDEALAAELERLGSIPIFRS